MTALEASLQLAFPPLSQTVHEPFELRLFTDRGARPVQVRPALVPAWTWEHPLEAYAKWLDGALLQQAPGHRRIRLYCTRAAAEKTRLTVMGGTAIDLGRRQEVLIETLVWVRATTKRLRYCYDQPEARIFEHSRFFDAQGRETELPHYDPESATFTHAAAVTGALVVEYTPEFTLYEITYDSGFSQTTPEIWRDMRLAWLAGSIHDAAVPPVRIIAVGPTSADQLTFSRDFWPARADTATGFKASDIVPFSKEGSSYRYKPSGDSSCWDRCKQRIQPDSSLLSEREMTAIRNCVQTAQNPRFQYVEESRVTRLERIFAPDNPQLYIDVARTVEMVLKLKRADDNPCEAQSGCCPELTLRFAGSS
ncbi:MAG: hypothetical protein H7834_05745 [Magnetococcus sp. YQC-9]